MMRKAESSSLESGFALSLEQRIMESIWLSYYSDPTT